ncbi:MAG: AraC family transcriptional regulator [Bacteroidota bacterium]
MKTIITADQLEEMFYESYEEKELNTSVYGFTERRFTASLSTGAGSFTDISFDEFNVGYGEIDLDRTTRLHYRSGVERVSMTFIFSGGMVMQHDGLSSEIEVQPHTHNLFYLHEEVGQKEWTSYGNGSLKAMEISLTSDFFMRLFPESGSFMKAFVKGITNKRSTCLSGHQPVITSQMLHIIHDIMHCNKPKSLKKLFIGSRIMELLTLQLEQVHCGTSSQVVSKQNQERMFEVKSFLETQLEPTFSIGSLAKDFATNEFTLKKEFKRLFGKSIFDYWNAVRFGHAKQLLKDGYPVQQLADKMGYSSPQNFSTAFKKRFGVVPSAYKR